MSAASWLLAYMATAVAHFLFAMLTRKDGYGSSFGSAALAVVFSFGWPVLWAFIAFEALLEWLPGKWDRVETWWDPEDSSHD